MRVNTTTFTYAVPGIGEVTFHYDESNTGLTAVSVNLVPVTLPKSILKQTTRTIIRKLPGFLTDAHRPWKDKCKVCGLLFHPHWIGRDGLCNGCRNPDSIVTAQKGE